MELTSVRRRDLSATTVASRLSAVLLRNHRQQPCRRACIFRTHQLPHLTHTAIDRNPPRPAQRISGRSIVRCFVPRPRCLRRCLRPLPPPPQKTHPDALITPPAIDPASHQKRRPPLPPSPVTLRINRNVKPRREHTKGKAKTGGINADTEGGD